MKGKPKLYVLFLLCLILTISFSTEETKAATSYTDAKTYYDTCRDKVQHIEFVDGQEAIYFATRAGVGSLAYKRFSTIGWEIRMEGGGKSISMDFKIDGSYLSRVHSKTYSDGYDYSLYSIKYETLCKIAEKKNPTAWEQIKKASEVKIYLDALVTWKNPGSSERVCDILSEDGYGNVSFKNSSYWRFSKDSDLEDAKDNFTSQSFKGYFNLEKPIPNYSFTVNYYAGYTDVTSSTGYKVNTTSGLIYSTTTTKLQMMQRFEISKLMHPNTTLGLKKTGYKLVQGKEWRTADKTRFYDASVAHYAVDLNDAVTIQNDTTLNLVANWEPISYKVRYQGNGGVGEAVVSSQKYNTSFKTIGNPFDKPNHKFIGWNTQANGTGVSYGENQTVNNLTSTDGDTVILYAQWEPHIFKINIVDDFGTGGTKTLYQYYGKRFSLKSDASTATSTIVLPNEVAGYSFVGVYASKTNKAELIINQNGEIKIGNEYFKKDNTNVYVHWEPNKYTITFDQQGGTNGTSSYVATYTKSLPNNLVKPAKTGWSFKGYYTKPEGQGTQYFNEFMNTDKKYDFTNDITLYAYWKDEELPTGSIKLDSSWTNNPEGVKIDVEAEDLGTGLSKVIFNREDEPEDVYLEINSFLPVRKGRQL